MYVICIVFGPVRLTVEYFCGVLLSRAGEYTDFWIVIIDFADLPKEGPHIEGGKARYAPGDMVRVNCTSSKSRPAATLAWYINGEPVRFSCKLLPQKSL